MRPVLEIGSRVALPDALWGDRLRANHRDERSPSIRHRDPAPDPGSLLNSERTAKASDTKVRLDSVVVDENPAEAPIAKQAAPEFPHFGRCLHPA